MSNSASHRTFWRLAGPMMLSNISVATLGLVDTAVIGHLGETYFLAAIAMGAIVFDFIYWSLSFLRMGTTSLIAQAEGDKNYIEVVAILERVLFLAVSISMFLLISQTFLIEAGLSLLKGSELAKQYAAEYCHIVIWGMPAVLATLSISGWLLGTHNAIATLKIALIVNIINIVLDIIFVVHLDFGIKGVAYATVIANYIGVVVALFFVFKQIKEKRLIVHWNNIFIWKKLKELFVFNRDIFIRTLCLLFTFAFFIRQSGAMGDTTLAVNSILIKFQIFMALSLDGYAQAAEVMVGNAIGSKRRKDFDYSVNLVIRWAVGTSLGFMLVYLLFNEEIIAVLTNIAAVKLMANDYIFWVIALPLISVWSFVYDGIFIGAGRAIEMRNNMLLSTFIIFLPAWYFTSSFFNHGLWFAFICFMICRGLGLAYFFKKLDNQGKFVANTI